MSLAELTDDTLVLTGHGPAPRDVSLVGARVTVPGIVEAVADDAWRATIPLAASRWSGPVLPLPSGPYVLRAPLVEQDVPPTLLPGLRIAISGSDVTIAPPIDPAYDHGEGQSALERRYAATPDGGHENAVFFESFYGRNASCNPRAIDAEIARVAPGVKRYWSVVDFSVEVPDGAVAVVEGSPAWWRARGNARLLVVNDWLRRAFVRRRGQHVLQTWHGTPLKRLALHRPGFDPRRALAVWRESRRWNALLAQNPYGARVFRSAYAFRRQTWIEGYPRNDVLVTGDGARVRAALGISADERVLLYAPTWRDDRTEMVDFLDLADLAKAAGAVVLVRGHSRTLPGGHDVHGPRVIDVTGFPDVSSLMLAADALITDYSSVMFDFSVTGKPMYFLVPDLEHYRGELRGFYFDLLDRAPGPVVQTQAELHAALERHDAGEFAGRYQSWRAVFNARDDGCAAARVVARLLDQRWIHADD